MHRAEYWHLEGDGSIRCELCPHACRLTDDRSGLCRVRRAQGGALSAIGYGQLSSMHVDPIEKKPLYHFYPGSQILSIGGWGCNFRCGFCQNWSISQQVLDEGTEVRPEALVAEARRTGSVGIAYTYNEPCIAFEYVRDCARLAREAGLVNVIVTNGFISPEPAESLLKWVDAANIDVKSMQESFYHEQCGGSLAPVLAFACQAQAAGCHVEVTNLVIPGLNDDDEAFRALSEWMKKSLGRGVPLHLSGYYPQYKMDRPATPSVALEHAHDLCRAHLDHVYIGNVRTAEGRDTRCSNCGATQVSRQGYTVQVIGIDEGHCTSCGKRSDVVTAEK